jgi:hypothetical protein
MVHAVLPLFEVVVLAACWALLGWRLLPARLRRDPDRLLVLTSAFTLGAGATACALTLMAAFHRLGPRDVRLLAGLSFIAALWIAVVHRRELLQQGQRVAVRSTSETIGLIALLAVLALCLVTTLAPPSSMDATVYHLRVPSEFLRTATWTKLEEPQSFQPLYVEMLFAEGLALNDGRLAALIHWVLGLGAIGCAACWSRRFGGRAIWGAVVFGTTALFVWEAGSAFIDLGLALFSGLGFLFAIELESEPGSTMLAGVFAGLAGGSKFTGLIVGALAAGAAFARAWPDRRRAVRRLVTVGGIALLVASPWYVRNLLLTGNPFYPLANRLFGLPPVTLVALKYGLGSDLGHLLTSPIDLLARGNQFDQGWAMGPAYLAFVPIALWLRRSRQVFIVLCCLVAWWLVWFFSSPQTRLLLPIMPMAAGLAAVGVAACFSSRGALLRLGAAAILAIAAASALGMAALGAKLNVRVALGLESRDRYLEQNSWNYVAYEQTNALLPRDARVASVGLGNNLYYLNRDAHWLGNDSRSTLELRAAGFTHELTIFACPMFPLDEPRRRVLAEGTYPLRASRLGGGVYLQACYRLSEVGESR